MMNIKKIAIGFLAIFLALFLIGFLLPKNYKVEREINIIAAPKMIFAFIGDLGRWSQWTTWARQDPQMEISVSTPSYGAGATQSWKSKSMGEGSAKVTEWSDEQQIAYDIVTQGFQPSHARISMTTPQQGATLKWTVEGSVGSGSFQRWFGLLIRYFIGRDIGKSLDNLKALAESSVAAEIKAPWHQSPKPVSKKK